MSKDNKFFHYLSATDEKTFSKMLVELYKSQSIDLKTASRIYNIYYNLKPISSSIPLSEQEFRYYRTTDNNMKLKLEIAFLIKTLNIYLEQGKSDIYSIKNTIERLKKILSVINRKPLSEEEASNFMTEIICIEVDYGIEIKFLESADRYLQDQIGKYPSVK